MSMTIDLFFGSAGSRTMRVTTSAIVSMTIDFSRSAPPTS
jgi:hypothetical protein